jgi:hypothetical protein
VAPPSTTCSGIALQCVQVNAARGREAGQGVHPSKGGLLPGVPGGGLTEGATLRGQLRFGRPVRHEALSEVDPLVNRSEGGREAGAMRHRRLSSDVGAVT